MWGSPQVKLWRSIVHIHKKPWNAHRSRSMLSTVGQEGTVKLTDFALSYTLTKTSSNRENRKPTRLIIPISSAVFAPNGGQHLFSEICKREKREREWRGANWSNKPRSRSALCCFLFTLFCFVCLRDVGGSGWWYGTSTSLVVWFQWLLRYTTEDSCKYIPFFFPTEHQLRFPLLIVSALYMAFY